MAAAAGLEDGILEPDPGPVGVHPPETGRAEAGVRSAEAQQGHFNPEQLMFRATGNQFTLTSQLNRHFVLIMFLYTSLLRGLSPNQTEYMSQQHAPGLLGMYKRLVICSNIKG